MSRPTVALVVAALLSFAAGCAVYQLGPHPAGFALLNQSLILTVAAIARLESEIQ